MYRPSHLAILLAITASATQAAEIRSELSDQQNVAITIYNGNLALVKEQRQIKLERGEIDLALRGSWVTLTNQSGATYNSAKLQLVAGDVHRAPVRMDGRIQSRRVCPI